MTDARDWNRVEAVTSDHLPACSRCGDLSTVGDKWCKTCGVWLLLTAPTTSEMTARRKAMLLAGARP